MRSLILMAMILPAGWAATELRAAEDRITGRLEMAIDGEQAVDFPIIIQVTLTNTSEKPLTWSATKSGAVPARLLRVLVRTADGKTSLEKPENEMGGTLNAFFGTPQPPTTLESQQQTTFNVFLNPLPIGEYRLRVITSGAATASFPELDSVQWLTIRVRANQRVVGQRQAAIVRAAAGGNAFDQYLAKTFGFSDDMDSLLEQLQSGDLDSMKKAADQLSSTRRMPPGSDSVLHSAIKQCDAQKADKRYDDTHWALFRLFLKSGRDEALDQLIETIDSGEQHNRTLLIDHLADFKQPRAAEWLIKFQNAANAIDAKAAVLALARRSHPAALEPLIKLAADPAANPTAFPTLASNYFDDPQVAKLIDQAAQSANAALSAEAKAAVLRHRFETQAKQRK